MGCRQETASYGHSPDVKLMMNDHEALIGTSNKKSQNQRDAGTSLSIVRRSEYQSVMSTLTLPVLNTLTLPVTKSA